MAKHFPPKFFGITTIGEKGQVVIPAPARVAMKIAKGETFIVMSPHGGALVLVKASQMEKAASAILKRIAFVKKKHAERGAKQRKSSPDRIYRKKAK